MYNGGVGAVGSAKKDDPAARAEVREEVLEERVKFGPPLYKKAGVLSSGIRRGGPLHRVLGCLERSVAGCFAAE